MEHWIDLYPDVPAVVPEGMKEAVRRLVDGSWALRSTQTVTGGLSRAELSNAMHPLLGSLISPFAGDAAFSSHLLDAVSVEDRTAVSVQAGRAHTNNEALLGVLAAASHPLVDWLILVVPERYKNSGAYVGVTTQLDALASSPGIDVDLRGIAVVAF